MRELKTLTGLRAIALDGAKLHVKFKTIDDDGVVQDETVKTVSFCPGPVSLTPYGPLSMFGEVYAENFFFLGGDGRSYTIEHPRRYETDANPNPLTKDRQQRNELLRLINRASQRAVNRFAEGVRNVVAPDRDEDEVVEKPKLPPKAEGDVGADPKPDKPKKKEKDDGE